MPDFNVRHPDFAAMEYRWRMARAFNLGGVAVLSPDFKVGTARVASMQRKVTGSDGSGGVAAEPQRTLSDYEWSSVATRSFIWKHDRETPEEYADRCRRAYHFPVFRYVLNSLAAGVMKDAPVRAGGEDVAEPWASYFKDVDRRNTRIDTFVRRALSAALTYGRCHAVTDMSRVESQPSTMAQLRDMQLRPYSYIITPLELVDWRLDEVGEWVWAVIQEAAPDDRPPGVESRDTVFQYRVWSRDSWELWRENQTPSSTNLAPQQQPTASGGFDLVASGPNPCGRVPISTLWATEEDQAVTMACESPLADVLDLNRHNLNELSELDEVDRAQAFAMLAVPTSEGQGGSIDIGPWRAFTFAAEAGKPEYISADAAHSAGRWLRASDKLQIGRQLANASRGKSEYSKEERSADALMVESSDKSNQMAWWSASTEEFERSLYRMVALWTGSAEDSAPEVHYQRVFDLRSLSKQIDDLTKLSKVVPPDTAIEIAKPIVSRVMTEGGAEPDAVREVVDAMEAPEPPPIVIAGGDPTEKVLKGKEKQGDTARPDL